MARNWFGGSAADFVFSQYVFAGRQLLDLSPASLQAFSAEEGGTQFTDLILDGVSVSTIEVGADGQIPRFQGPDTGEVELWVSADGGPRTLLAAPGRPGADGTNGLPGVNAVANDTATAGYVATPGSATDSTLRANYLSVGTTTIDVEKYGGDLNAAITANSGTNIRFILSRPLYTLTATAILNAGCIIEGVGAGLTKITLANGVNDDVIRGVNFAALTGKAYASSDVSAGAAQAELRRLLIDGNKANQTAGYGVRVWGRSLRFSDLLVTNCKQDGIWTEYTTHPDGGLPSMIEGFFERIKTHGNGVNGWTFRGPHDSYIDKYNTVSNGAWGFENASSAGHYVGGFKGGLWNSWLNTTGSFKFGAEFGVAQGIASGAGGLGIDIGAGVGSGYFSGTIGGHTDGMIVRGTNHRFAITFNGLSGTAVQIGSTGGGNGAGMIELDLLGDTVGTVLSVVNETGPITARGRFSAVTTLLTGGTGSLDYIDLAESGDSAGAKLLLPGNGFTAIGWSPRFPASNDTLVTRSSTDKLSNKIIGHLAAAQTLAANGAVTMDSSAGSVQRVTLNANATSSTLTNAATNAQLTIEWIQDATGGRTYVWPTSCKFAGGAGPSDTTASTRSSATFIHDGSFWREVSRAVAVPA